MEIRLRLFALGKRGSPPGALSPFDCCSPPAHFFCPGGGLPQVADEDPDVPINPDGYKDRCFPLSGAGGQNVQKNATAIRITHIPTGLVVTCQNERSQMQNRENRHAGFTRAFLEIKRRNKIKQLADIARRIYQKPNGAARFAPMCYIPTRW